MKKAVLVVVIFLTFVQTQAQEQEAYKQDAITWVEIKLKSQYEFIYEQVAALIPDHNLPAFKAEMDKELNLFNERLAKEYMQVFTHDEIKEILKFYNTEVGKKVIEKSLLLDEASVEAGQELSLKLQALLGKYAE
ncbi:MAG: DUF2059 domain-containing protein [Mesonia hippocampi]|uniref:DUF2059 domain-containing protein n=1 Tax=Mesonia hippocampi TaxID=1628250 RepID=UPI003F9550FA